jgi:hypothetical protein
MHNDEPHVRVVSKIAFAPIMLSRWPHFVAAKAGEGTVEREFGSVSGSCGIHFRISMVSILKGKRVSSVSSTTYEAAPPGRREMWKIDFHKFRESS